MPARQQNGHHLTVRDLAVGWNGRPILSGVNFSINLSQFNRRVPIIGRTGSGKTTLLYALAGQSRPLAGSVEWSLAGGHNLHLDGDAKTAEAARRHHFAFAFQDAALISHLTVRENIRLPLELADPSRDDDELDQQVDTLIDDVLTPLERVAEMATRFPAQLSGGQRQRMAFAQAIAINPHVLFSDEPTGSLDPDTRSEINACIDRWLEGDASRAFMWITHHNDRSEFSQAPLALHFAVSDQGSVTVETVETARIFATSGAGEPAEAMP